MNFLHHTQRHTTVGRIPLDKWSARRRDLYLTTHNTHNRQTSMSRGVFEPTISAAKRPQTYALDCAATGTGCVEITALKRVFRKKRQVYPSNFLPNLASQDFTCFNSRKVQLCTWKGTVVRCMLCFILVCGILQVLRGESSLQCPTPTITGHVIKGFTCLFLCALYRIPCLWNKSFLQSTDPLNTYKFTAVCSVTLLLMLPLHYCYYPTIIFSQLSSNFNLSY